MQPLLGPYSSCLCVGGRLSEQARRQLEKSSTKFEDLNLGDKRPTQLIRRYGNLYTESRLEALDALDDIAEMSEFADLKGKLLLTILVVSILLHHNNCTTILFITLSGRSTGNSVVSTIEIDHRFRQIKIDVSSRSYPSGAVSENRQKIIIVLQWRYPLNNLFFCCRFQGLISAR